MIGLRKGKTAKDRDTAIFVGGIVGCVTEKEIRDYFERFGPIFSITLIPKKDNPKLNSGYCFISFKESHTKYKVLARQDHFLYGRRVSCKSLLKGTDLKEEKNKNLSKKLCIKYLPVDTTEAEFKSFFSQFGEIHTFYLVTYKNTKPPTCNGYLVFREEADFRRLLAMKYINYGLDRLKVERYIKRFQRESDPNEYRHHSLTVEMENEPLCFLKPTQSLYHKNGRFSVGNQESNVRFNILLEPPVQYHLQGDSIFASQSNSKQRESQDNAGKKLRVD